MSGKKDWSFSGNRAGRGISDHNKALNAVEIIREHPEGVMVVQKEAKLWEQPLLFCFFYL
ncbi:hypothetical protein EGM51_08490 [Verrucomicrobia bacterium S94]|nr:hypothetical protein EGM51_08490 [Verrucomicrobia bacterium S94]